MRTRRIFILTPQALLSRGMEQLLRDRPSFQLVGCETDVSRGVEDIERLHPDVVILAQAKEGPVSMDEVSSVFEASPGTAVISIGSGTNLLHIYQEDQISVGNVEDLVRAIREVPLRARALRRREQ